MIAYLVLLTLPLMSDFASQKGLEIREIEEGYSETPIYLLSEKGSPKYVAKEYKPGSRVLNNDLLGQRSALALHLCQLRVPKILSVETVGDTVVVTQEFVPGLSLWKIKDPEVFRQLGRGLREYHDKSTWQVAPPSEKLVGHLNWVVERSLNRAEILGMTPEEMKRKIGTLGNQPVPWSLLHHDPQLGNYLYEAESGKISMIDFGDGASFIDECGRGIGTPLYDYVKVADHLRFHKEECLIAFQEGYGPIGDEESLRYFYIVNAVASLEWHLKVKGKAHEPLMKRLHELFNE
jgi:hypothetical protein